MINDKIFGTYEWATHTINILNGCKHDCKYCYSKEMAIRFKRKNKNNWKNEELIKDTTRLSIPKDTGTIMFPSSHDLSSEFIDDIMNVIKFLINRNKQILLVTKPHLSVIEQLCSSFFPYRNIIKFRFSIGSVDNSILKFWEPNAPDISERIEALKLAYKQKFQTSVSCEPILDDNTIDLVNLVLPYVTDSIWIGKPNFLKRRLKINGYNENSIEQKIAEDLLLKLDDKFIENLYGKFRNNSKIKWKESIKKIVGIKIPCEVGQDI